MRKLILIFTLSMLALPSVVASVEIFSGRGVVVREIFFGFLGALLALVLWSVKEALIGKWKRFVSKIKPTEPEVGKNLKEDDLNEFESEKNC